jgi:hypothetical protein
MIILAAKMEVMSILGDVDIDIPCDIQDYDQCLTEQHIIDITIWCLPEPCALFNMRI